MFYFCLRIYVRFVLKLFVKNLTINGLENIPKSGAVLLAASHPNSFFDAILLACVLDRPMWSLARGDAFKKNWLKAFFLKIKMMPIYRLSEGKEFLGENDVTFNKCLELFRADEMVLIFPEGICTNQVKLLPLKKGTARLVQKAWAEDLSLKIIPIGLVYDSYKIFGKNIEISIEKPIQRTDFQGFSNNGFFFNEFNNLLSEKLNPLVSATFQRNSFSQNPIFYLGKILNFPMYFICQQLSRKFTKGTVFYDSVVFGAMVFLLPIYWLGLCFLAFALK